MKRIIVLLFLLAVTAVAQTSAPTSLELGRLKVHLGMSRAEVVSGAAKLGYTVHEDEATGFATITNDETDGPACSVRFKGGRLVYATRSWKNGQNDDWRALTGALSTVDGRICHVFSSRKSEPGVDTTRYFLDCGEHSLYIEDSIYGSGLRVNDVGEIIGDPEGRPLSNVRTTTSSR